jgi:hypothetical protein
MALTTIRDDSDDVFRGWVTDFETITNDTYELFALRRTFRDVAEVFQKNVRLQQAGGHLWEWMLLNYVGNVLMRIRRLVDSQHGTVNFKQLMHAIEGRPTVITRARREAMHGPASSELVQKIVSEHFTKTWVRKQQGAAGAPQDAVDAAIVASDRDGLEAALERVTEFANRTVAHRTRIAPGQITYKELDAAFDAVEATLKKYYELLKGGALVSAEPAPQFNTHDVFTFPWIEPAPDDRPND